MSLEFLTQRAIVVGLAVIGATLVMAASAVAPEGASRPRRRLAQVLSVVGYAITLASVGLFIVAGFVSSR